MDTHGVKLSPMTVRVLSFGGALSVVAATRWALRRGWRAYTGEDPPDDPTAPGVTWSNALAWGVASGVVVGAARVVGERLATGVRETVDG